MNEALTKCEQTANLLTSDLQAALKLTFVQNALPADTNTHGKLALFVVLSKLLEKSAKVEKTLGELR